MTPARSCIRRNSTERATGTKSPARCCVSHATWQDTGVSFEERSVALADKLWKGKREPALELRVVDDVALRLGGQRWDVFGELDSVFEEIAAGAALRLERSRVGSA
jgi:hypothetical protein